MASGIRRCERPIDHLATGAAVVAASVTALVYLAMRVPSSTGDAFIPLALPLLGAEVVLIVVALVPLWPALLLRRDGTAPPEGTAPPDGTASPAATAPMVDVVVVVRTERLLDLRVALRACREMRGTDGLVVVGGDGRRGIDAICRAFGVPRLGPEQLDGLGTELHRRAPLLMIVPASAWVAPDAAAILAPAMAAGEAAAATGLTVVHGVVDLLGSEGYLPAVDAHADLALRLDRARSAPPRDGPLLFGKAALRSIGGVDWTAPDPGLGAHAQLRRQRLGTRVLDAPIAYRMAPADEAHALAGRARRVGAWRAALGAAAPPAAELDGGAAARPTPSPWHGWVHLLASVEPLAAPARLVLLFMPLGVALTGRTPVSAEHPVALVGAAVCFWVGLALARHRTDQRPVGRFARLRGGVRALGADLGSLSPPTPGVDLVARARRIQFGVLAALLVSVIASTVLLTRDVIGGTSALGRWPGLVVAAAVVATAVLVRDAATAYRQQRLLPRVHYEARHDGDLTDLSPTGYTIAAAAAVGETRTLELDLPYPGERIRTVRLPGVVSATRTRGPRTLTYVEIDTDHETFEQLIYFCAVTAPTVTWQGGAARALRHRGSVPTEALSSER